MNVNTARVIEEFEEMGLFRKGELVKETTFEYAISKIDNKWDLLSSKQQCIVCFLLSALSLLSRY
jgi:hypothetical protein